MTSRILRRRQDIKCKYTSSAAAREEAGFKAMGEYIWRRQNTVAHFIAIRSMMELCEETEITPGAQVGMRWWEQAGIDVTRGRERVLAAADAEVDKYMGEQ